MTLFANKYRIESARLKNWDYSSPGYYFITIDYQDVPVETGLKPVSTGTSGTSVWQTRFHDHIIRDENDLNRIRKYIIENPSNWEMDEYANVRSAQSTSVKDE